MIQEGSRNKIWGAFPSFVGAFSDARDLPQHEGLEVAFIGRSNVGKSSIVNALFNTKKLARVSQTPGCTKALMLFQVTPRFYIMDLPGYGFSKQSKAIKGQWEKAINSYLAYRRHLSQVYLLIDGRHGPKNFDHVMIQYLNHYAIAHTCVLTKMDKATEKEKLTAVRMMDEILDHKSTNAHLLETSSMTRLGLAELQESILSYVGALK